MGGKLHGHHEDKGATSQHMKALQHIDDHHSHEDTHDKHRSSVRYSPTKGGHAVDQGNTPELDPSHAHSSPKHASTKGGDHAHAHGGAYNPHHTGHGTASTSTKEGHAGHVKEELYGRGGHHDPLGTGEGHAPAHSPTHASKKTGQVEHHSAKVGHDELDAHASPSRKDKHGHGGGHH